MKDSGFLVMWNSGLMTVSMISKQDNIRDAGQSFQGALFGNVEAWVAS